MTFSLKIYPLLATSSLPAAAENPSHLKILSSVYIPAGNGARLSSQLHREGSHSKLFGPKTLEPPLRTSPDTSLLYDTTEMHVSLSKLPPLATTHSLPSPRQQTLLPPPPEGTLLERLVVFPAGTLVPCAYPQRCILGAHEGQPPEREVARNIGPTSPGRSPLCQAGEGVGGEVLLNARNFVLFLFWGFNGCLIIRLSIYLSIYI